VIVTNVGRILLDVEHFVTTSMVRIPHDWIVYLSLYWSVCQYLGNLYHNQGDCIASVTNIMPNNIQQKIIELVRTAVNVETST